MPRPKATAAHIEMTGRKSRAIEGDEVSEIVGGRPKCPRHLSRAAKVEWRRALHELEERKVLTKGDYTLIAVYAEVFARWIAAKTSIGDQLMVEDTVLTSNGNPITKMKLNPLLKVAADCEGRLLSLAHELSLTPVVRDKVKPTGASKKEIIPGTLGWYRQQKAQEQQNGSTSNPENIN